MTSTATPAEQIEPPTHKRSLWRRIWSVARWVFFSIGCAVTLLVGVCVYSELVTSVSWDYERLAPQEDVEILDSAYDYYDGMHGDNSVSYLIRLRTPEAAARFVQEIHKRGPLTGEYAMECDAPFAFCGRMYDRCRREFGDQGTHYRFFLYGDCPYLHHGIHHRGTMVHIYGGENHVFYVNIRTH